jgi:diketogulonate reductase-like aldo/keto reductase
VKRGEVTIPFAVKRGQLIGNLKAAVDSPLTAEDMRAIAEIDKKCRLIKGQVFLWREGLTWEALWDEDGVIMR